MAGGGASAQKTQFQSTLLMRGATLQRTETWRVRDISIHAPHARSDWRSDGPAADSCFRISIHAPHARSDDGRDDLVRDPALISIHAPHARSDDAFAADLLKLRTISIHAPHARSD